MGNLAAAKPCAEKRQRQGDAKEVRSYFPSVKVLSYSASEDPPSGILRESSAFRFMVGLAVNDAR